MKTNEAGKNKLAVNREQWVVSREELVVNSRE
jgi:hypothetical protein